MNTTLSHLLFNVKAENMGFYKALFGFLGWPSIHEEDGILGVGGEGQSVWFGIQELDAPNNYDGAGLNHIGLGAASIADVDATVEHIRSIGIAPLFETPRHRPEFSADEQSTYYQVMFESPDRILFEVVYIGPK